MPLFFPIDIIDTIDIVARPANALPTKKRVVSRLRTASPAAPTGSDGLKRQRKAGAVGLSQPKKKEHPTLNLKKARNLKFAKTFGKMKQDVLFCDTLRLETSRTRGCDNVG